MLKSNKKYEILTKDGFKDFDGINSKFVEQYIKLTLKSGKILECSLNHRIKTRKGFKEVQDVHHEEIETSEGWDFIINIECISEDILVYDPINVKGDNTYLSNYILSHNCEFLGTGDTFINSDDLTKIHNNISAEFEETYHRRLRTWEEVNPHSLYMLGIDPAFGTGKNKTAFHIIDLYTGAQVAEFYSNETKTKDVIPIIFALGNEYNQAMIVCERNSLGMIILQDLFEKYEYENVYMDAEDGELGVPVYNKASRDTLLEALEESIYNNKVIIRSDRLFDELASFIITETGKIEADEGYTDDLVIAWAICCHIRNKLIESGSIEPNFKVGKVDNNELPSIYSSKYVDEDVRDYHKWILS